MPYHAPHLTHMSPTSRISAHFTSPHTKHSHNVPQHQQRLAPPLAHILDHIQAPISAGFVKARPASLLSQPRQSAQQRMPPSTHTHTHTHALPLPCQPLLHHTCPQPTYKSNAPAPVHVLVCVSDHVHADTVCALYMYMPIRRHLGHTHVCE